MSIETYAKSLRSDAPTSKPYWEKQEKEKHNICNRKFYKSISIASILIAGIGYQSYQIDLAGFRSYIVDPILEFLEIQEKPNFIQPTSQRSQTEFQN